ncbi:hypothetical protein LPJ61_005511 [Coemansia biformis]|uniref:Uncharacterized protein n=1 Tax=Coemansia biformis TaxID=1286918 RepID=A0A9W7Y2Z0_9FUNG|nr:hypothetical protein LPJ61_005511 [Coemansia biformis]
MSNYGDEGYGASRGYRPQVEEHKSNAVKDFFTDEDGSLNKSRIAAVTALLAGGGFAAKKTYDHLNGEEEEEHEADEEETHRIHQFFTDDDGTLDKSKIAAVSALLLGSGFAIKKAHDHYSRDDDEEQQQQQQHEDDNEHDSPNRFKQFFTDEDGSIDKSHVFAASALGAGLALFGKKVYEGRRND